MNTQMDWEQAYQILLDVAVHAISYDEDMRYLSDSAIKAELDLRRYQKQVEESERTI